MALTRDDLFASPDHYLHSFEGDAAVFVPMDRAAYYRSIFLDSRISPAADGTIHMPVSALTAAIPRPPATGWIFHFAHCGSTLLARAVDHLSSNLVLREPLALRQTAVAYRPGRGAAERLALVVAMLSKRYRADTPTVVKANVPVNFLLPELAAADPLARAIFLYLPLRDYLLAILRSDNHREWLRRVTTLLAPWLGEQARLSDAERVAALWLAQVSAFATALGKMEGGRSLDAEAFFANPGITLSAVADRLQIPLSCESLETIVAGSLFSTYSKNPAIAFDNMERLARRAALETLLAAEIVQAQRWIEPRAAEADAACVVLESRKLFG
jgi:hypothetical protein